VASSAVQLVHGACLSRNRSNAQFVRELIRIWRMMSGKFQPCRDDNLVSRGDARASSSLDTVRFAWCIQASRGWSYISSECDDAVRPDRLALLTGQLVALLGSRSPTCEHHDISSSCTGDLVCRDDNDDSFRQL